MITNYQDVTAYIHKYWGQVAFAPGKKPHGGLKQKIQRIGYVPLPNTALAPNSQQLGMQHYRDTYFVILGLVVDGYTELARGLVDNLCYLHDTFGLVPARNATTSRGRTQPPFLTRMAWEVFEHEGGEDREWLGKVLAVAQKEYEQVWCGKRRYIPELGLSRYNPKPAPWFVSAAEHGWDQSARFSRGPHNIAPVDLNAQLFAYEEDMRDWAAQNASDQVQIWQERMDRRRALIAEYFWDEQTGYFYDYDFRAKQRRPLRTLAGFYPLWAGAATPEQARRCVEQLHNFEYGSGLANTEAMEWRGRQWDYPNGCAPLQYIVVSGLRRYGFNEEAVRLTGKWLELNRSVLKSTGALWEAYDVVKGGVGLPGRHPVNSGYSWTCGVFSRLLADLEDL